MKIGGNQKAGRISTPTTTNHYGIDYSMTSPGICFAQVPANEPFHLDHCTFYFATGNKKNQGIISDRIYGFLFTEDDWSSCEDRFDKLSSWALSNIAHPSRISSLCIEGYAMGAKGQVFHIGECGGILKHKLWKEGYTFDLIPPTTVKKFGCGKGNGNKDVMYEAFYKETSYDLKSKFVLKSNPVSDLVDAFYLCKYGWDKWKGEQNRN